ncbi:murein transglycosylase [Vibrio mediterranei]|uniref:murein transglycosylase n=1 Tax=Vibrio mediterranei TaxID=689 RepID=UPI004068B8CB
MFLNGRYCQRLLAATSIIITSLSGSVLAADATLERQRAVYEQAQKLIDDKDIEGFQKLRPKIVNYPLTPYVDYRVFSLELADKSIQEVNDFIENHQGFPFSTRIRAPYLDHLVRQKRWQDILTFQNNYPNGERYQCHYHYAQYQTGDRQAAFDGAQKLWLSGTSVDDACDKLFEVWNKAGVRSDNDVTQRMILAFEQRNGALLNYLNRQLTTPQGKKQGEQILTLYKAPETVTSFAKSDVSQPQKNQLTEIALQKLARSNEDKAKTVVTQLSKIESLDAGLRQSMREYVAMRFITTESSIDAKWRDQVLSQSESIVYLERRARLAVQQADWAGLEKWIGLLPLDEQRTSRWQYWLARAELKTGEEKLGTQRMESIVGQRNFYSAAAATYLDHSIVYPVSTTTLDADAIAPFQVSLVRIEELVDREKIAAAKSEWRYLLSNASEQEKQMLAAYAGKKRWHHFSVVATISAKMWDNMTLRFPTAHQWWFEFYSDKLDLDSVLLMALARQESAMDSEARSPVGARGVMQIMPATAKYTAKKHKIPYKRTSELYQVGKNIEIGSHYLNELLGNYDDNRIFALAAYNAGPNRVKRWREESEGKLDAIAFIESIPFRETRGYVQNILMFQVYYRDLLGVQGSFLTDEEANKRY